MKRLFLLVLLPMVAFALAQSALAQATAPAEMSKAEIVITKHSNPIYPPLARQARIMGDVTIRLGLRQDGSVGSAEVMSGHPLLAPAALESAQKSTFECRGCSDAETPYLLTYTFRIADCGASEADTRPPDPVDTERHGHADVEVVACTSTDSVIIDYWTPVRSAKCLYLWKCGHR